MRFDDMLLAVILYSIMFGPFVLFAGSFYFAFKKRSTPWIVAAVIFGLWSCWWLWGYSQYKEGWSYAGPKETLGLQQVPPQSGNVPTNSNTSVITQSGSTAISKGIFVELQDMNSPLARYYIGTYIHEDIATVRFDAGAEAYLNAQDTNVNPVKNNLLKMQGISLVQWEVGGKTFAKFTK